MTIQVIDERVQSASEGHTSKNIKEANWYFRTAKKLVGLTVEGTACSIGAYYISYYILGLSYEYEVIDWCRNKSKPFLLKRYGRFGLGWGQQKIDYYLPYAIQKTGLVVGGIICYLIEKIVFFIWNHIFPKPSQKAPQELQSTPEIPTEDFTQNSTKNTTENLS